MLLEVILHALFSLRYVVYLIKLEEPNSLVWVRVFLPLRDHLMDGVVAPLLEVVRPLKVIALLESLLHKSDVGVDRELV
jgi:hypothetical protein